MDCKSGKVRRAVLYLLVLIGGATGVRNLEVTVPAMVRSGDSALLSCRYEVEGVPLYRMTWYFNEYEFYRYVPTKLPPQQSYPVPGIRVDHPHSNMHEVTLKNVSRMLTGIYKCEVSEDSPSYHTISETGRMEVADVPETDPVIMVEKQRLPAGEILRGNCTSGTSHPAPDVTWTLNGEPLNETTMQYKTWTRKVTEDRMEYTWSGLELKVTGPMFNDGCLQLRCFVTIPGVYTATAEIDVNEDKPLIASITGDASPHSNPSNGTGNSRFSSLSTGEALMRIVIVIGSMVLLAAGFR